MKRYLLVPADWKKACSEIEWKRLGLRLDDLITYGHKPVPRAY